MTAKRQIRQFEDYKKIERAIWFVEEHFKSQPSLEEIARSVNLSKYHFQRLFKRWAGVSPTQFLQFLTLEYAKKRLENSHNILDTAYDSGLSGPGRLHDLFVTFEAITPGEYKKMGEGMKIEYGYHLTPFGECLIAVTERGICHLAFLDDSQRKKRLAYLSGSWPKAKITENQLITKPVVKQIFEYNLMDQNKPFHLFLKGTNFQINVWRALLTIPRGNVVSYSDVASFIGNPGSYRAAAGAMGANPVAYLIPCHRVISQTGMINNYRWGAARKKAILGWEAAKAG